MPVTTKERTTKHNANNTDVTKPGDESLISSLVLNGDLSKLTPPEKVEYYGKFCARLGLDPLSQPFKLLRLGGREIMYCDRSGAQQLNKLHQVSHDITAREIEMGCYAVTAQASLPDGRHTESIGAVFIDGLKGEALCNAMMKAETKAKRRATLDLLGLGMLDETEATSIPGAELLETTYHEIKDEAKGNVSPFKKKYDTIHEVDKALATATDIKDVANLYYANAEMIEAHPDLKAKFTKRKKEFNNTNTI